MIRWGESFGWNETFIFTKLSQVVQAILRHVNFDVAKAVLIASPGFVRQQFFDYMYQQVCFLLQHEGHIKFLSMHSVRL